MSTNTLKQALEIVYGDIKDINKRVKNLESASAGVLYTETTKSAVAYQDNVSANACPYALLNKVGGMSYKSENLIVEQKQVYLRSGNEKWVSWNITGLVIGQQYTIITFNPSFSNERWQVANYSYASFTQTNPYTFTATSTNLAFRVGANNLANDINFESKVMLVSGSTAPTTYQPYFEGIRDSAVISVVSKDSNNTTLQTLNIPNEIQALDGYGWGINDTCYNYIDFVNKKFIQKVGRIIVDSNTNFNWIPSSLNSCTTVPTPRAQVGGSTVMLWLSSNTNIVSITGEANGGIYTTFSEAYESADDLKAAMIGTIIYYPLAKPIETDISQYIDDNSIQIEANGTITFNNQYQQAIPYEYLYLEKVGANNE